jgi:hypothetical protein
MHFSTTKFPLATGALSAPYRGCATHRCAATLTRWSNGRLLACQTPSPAVLPSAIGRGGSVASSERMTRQGVIGLDGSGRTLVVVIASCAVCRRTPARRPCGARSDFGLEKAAVAAARAVRRLGGRRGPACATTTRRGGRPL